MATILVVDDNPTIRLLLQRQLRSLGMEACAVPSGEEAIEAFQQGSFDLVILDIAMPVMDGIEATRKLREIESERGTERVPMIGLTGGVNYNLRDCLEAGMDDVMQKPALLKELGDRLSAWLN